MVPKHDSSCVQTNGNGQLKRISPRIIVGIFSTFRGEHSIQSERIKNM